MPQKWTKSYWKEKWNKEEVDLFLHDIGNLTLTFDNSVYGNKPFPEKKGKPGKTNCYAASNLFQERELAKHKKWTVNTLKTRRKKIIKWAIERWQVSDDDIAEIELEDEAYDELESKVGNGLTDLEDEEDEVQEKDLKVKKISIKWSDEEIYEYLDYLKEWVGFTYCYFKVLATVEGKIEYNEFVRRIRDESGKDFDGRKFAGVAAGLTRRASKRGGERLDRISEAGWAYSLNKKYKATIKKYFEQT